MKRSRTPGHARFAAVAVAAGAFVCLAGVGYAAGLVHFTHSSATSAQYPPSKVTICHHTHSQHNPFVTITVSEHALPAHLGHGDTVGPCPPQGTTGAQGPVETPKVHANGHSSHGHQGGKGSGKGHEQSSTSDHGNHGQGNNGHGKGHGPSGVPGKGHGKGHGPQGHGKGHGPGQGHGHGQGHHQGHGPGGKHGNSGGGKGHGKKP